MQKKEIEQIILIKAAIYKKSLEKNIIDLVFAILLFLQRLICYKTREKFHYDSDY